MLTSGNGIYGVIAVLLLAAPVVVWLGLRLYTAIAPTVCCRGCRRLSESERTERCPLSAGMLEELEKAGRNVRWALIVLLILLVGWWMLGTTSDQSMAINGIGLGALSCCAIIVLGMLTKLIASIALPAAFSCRTRVLQSLKKNGGGFGWLLLVYVIVHILLTI